MRALVRHIRDALRGTQDTVCLERAQLVTEAYREHEGDPAEHQDLVVRVAGFSARFIDLSKAEQEELIPRAEHEGGLASQGLGS